MFIDLFSAKHVVNSQAYLQIYNFGQEFCNHSDENLVRKRVNYTIFKNKYN
jgi:hypothetical protein